MKKSLIIILLLFICENCYCEENTKGFIKYNLTEYSFTETKFASNCKEIIDSVIIMADKSEKNTFFISFQEKYNTIFCFIQDWDLNAILDCENNKSVLGFMTINYKNKKYTFVIINKSDKVTTIINQILCKKKDSSIDINNIEQAPNSFLATDSSIIVYLSRISGEQFIPMYIIDNGKIIYDNRVISNKE